MTYRQGNYVFGLLSMTCLTWALWQALWGTESLPLILLMGFQGLLGTAFASLVHIWAGGDVVFAMTGVKTRKTKNY